LDAALFRATAATTLPGRAYETFRCFRVIFIFRLLSPPSLPHDRFHFLRYSSD
jgi:hypothetical protein